MAGATAPDLFGFLPVAVTSIGASPPFQVTPFGASLGLVSGELNAPTHNSFGAVGGLDVVDRDTSGAATTLAGDVTVGGGVINPVPAPRAVLVFTAGLLVVAAGVRRRR